MTTNGQTDEKRMEFLRGRLDEARRAWRRVDLAWSALRGVTFVLASLLAGLVADNVLVLPGGVRATALAAFGACVLYFLVVRPLFCLVRPLTDEMVARRVERKYPQLDNRLINAVLLHKQRIADPVTRKMVASQLGETVSAVRTVDPGASTSREPLWRWSKWAAVLLVAVSVYGIAFSRHFVNAARRYVSPHRHIPPITDTVLTVHPGDAERLQGESLAVEAHIEGVLPETAYIYYDDEEGTVRKAMSFEGSFFAYQFVGLQRSFRYWVRAGDATSRTYSVTVRTRPSVQTLKLTYVYPEYTGLPSRSEESQTGNVRALTGTRVRLEAAADRPLRKAVFDIEYLVPGERPGEADAERVDMELTTPRVAAIELEVRRSGQYRIRVWDEADVPNQPVARQLVALPDDPPFVDVVEPGRDVTVEPDGKVPLLAEARDDFSVRSLDLWIQRAAGQEWETLRSWSYENASRQIRGGAVINVAELDCKAGDVLTYYFRADDGRPGRGESDGKSRLYQIAVVDREVAEANDEQRRAGLRNLINRLIAMQKGNLEATRRLGRWMEEGKPQIAGDEEAREEFQAGATVLVKAQEEIYALATDGVRRYAGGELGDMVEALASIAAEEMTLAADQLVTLNNSVRSEQIGPSAQRAAQTEARIVELLGRLLEDPRALLAERLQERGASEELSEEPEDLMGETERAEALLEAIKRFREEQREVIELTRQLSDVPVDEFTEEHERRLGQIVEKELRWAEYFQETATDLSKVAPQDFSLGSLAKEHLEVYSEVLKAADAAQRRAVEIACAMEEGASAKAETIEENIEKWLMDSPDREAWKVEEPDHELDVPLADLPDELEDLIGDLLEEEEELLEEAEDATSGWLGSADKGIGWDTMDGPFSNMTAKGVTGNRLPDVHEVGGRSGEGRTGKASGQHVEETATGKGGRRTPTRLTPDPFEAGVVQDTSAEPPTGSTGGGKVSGAGKEGFQGPLPPAAREALRRLAHQQQQLIDKARRLDFGLEKYRYPRGRLPDTIELMEEIQGELDAGTFIPTAARQHRVVLSDLREIKDLVQKQKQLARDRSALLPEELREEIAAALRQDVPREYREMVDNYFRALSEAGTR